LVVQRQLDLFAAPALGFDAGFAKLVRRELARGAWVDYQQGFVQGHDVLFEQLEHELRWKTERRRMYDRMVTTPRLLASITADHLRSASRDGRFPHPCRVPRARRLGLELDRGTPALALVEAIRRALSDRYGEDFVRVSAALYRDGSDSVAMHGDTTARDMDQALVATVSLGQPRRSVLRPAALEDADPEDPVETVHYELGQGDLIVMGGTCQRTWRHGIPKSSRARGPRIALMFRPAWSEDY
jgi:alkylated DNA repair dioxygenase AlkB